MHNIKLIRKNPEEFKKKILSRNVDLDINKISDLDSKSRELIQKKENLEKEKKIISKQKDQALFEKSKEITLKIDDLSKKQLTIKNELDNLLKSIPNIALDDVPVGKDENYNKEIEKKG